VLFLSLAGRRRRRRRWWWWCEGPALQVVLLG
jgi:hypothetical protein